MDDIDVGSLVVNFELALGDLLVDVSDSALHLDGYMVTYLHLSVEGVRTIVLLDCVPLLKRSERVQLVDSTVQNVA